MNYSVAKTKEEGLKQLTALVKSFQSDYKTFKSSKYNETQLRNDFVDSLLMSFGWDVDNESGLNQYLRDVIQEEYISVEDENSKKNPDYTLRVQGIRKIFVEAKKPNVEVTKSAKAAFQTRRYGWNGNLGISVLTNFEHIVIYDCRSRPSNDHDERVSRIKVVEYQDYVKRFDELYEFMSFESVASGHLDEILPGFQGGSETFDEYFLAQIEEWRERLATSAILLNDQLDSEDINFLIQRLLNRVVFLRICEDRTIENYETLKNVSTYSELKEIFSKADRKYNSGLFDFIEDNLSMEIEIDSDVLISMFNELYYPLSPYDFSVVDSSVLSQIYEKFLGSIITVNQDRQLSIVAEPEIVASNGVVPTPKIVVEGIVRETLSKLVEGKGMEQIRSLKIADICCGSGTFLITVFDFLLRSVIDSINKKELSDSNLIVKLPNNSYQLTLKAKRDLILSCIFGVDVNPYASEVTEFSLQLKILEGETGGSVDHFINQYEEKVLPHLRDNIKCGNSLVDYRFFEFMPNAKEDNDLLYRVKPFQWDSEFPFLEDHGGFDAIVGNPPYVRIQNMIRYSPEEIKYYQNTLSGYTVAAKESVDKYYVFIQRAISLLNKTGFLGYIIPNKFFILKGGKSLRKYITQSSSLHKIIHFGTTQVFPDKLTYTAILVLQIEHGKKLLFKRIRKLSAELLSEGDGYLEHESQRFNAEPWIFLSPETASIFDKLSSERSTPLQELAEICVGIQTSADKVYTFIPKSETDHTFVFDTSGGFREIEKAICQPFIKDLQFSLFDTINPNAQVIFPYKVANGSAEAIDEDSMKKEFPLCWSYLNEFKEKLGKRSINGRNPKWYQFGRSQSLSKFQGTPKVVWPVLSKSPSYVVDHQDILFGGGGNGPYYSLLSSSWYDLEYFIGILSHPIFESMVKSGASEFQGDYYSHGKQFIQNVPIMEIDKNDREQMKQYKTVVKLVKGLIKAKSAYNEGYGSKKVVLQRKIDMLNTELIELVNVIYGITQDEFETVLNEDVVPQELLKED